MKSSHGSDEIFGVPPQMKLNPSSYPDEVGFHHEVISSHDSGIYPVRKDGFSWKKRASQRLALFFLEATIGIGPMNKGFADLCLTAWLRRHMNSVPRPTKGKGSTV